MSMDVCLLHLVYKVLKAFGDLRIWSRIFLSNTTHLIVLLCICFRTNNFVLMCLYNVLHMYLIKLIFPDLYIWTKIKKVTTKSKYVIFFCFYVILHISAWVNSCVNFCFTSLLPLVYSVIKNVYRFLPFIIGGIFFLSSV